MYRCLICGYVYNPNEGDTLQGIDPNTQFEEIHESWVCPVCGVTKEHFEKI